jgi:hypothetical protein
MRLAVIFITLLSHQGYWIGGQDQSISLSWAVQQKMPAATLQWELMFDHVRLGGDQIPMPPDNVPAVVKLKTPVVRARTQMRWVYHVIARDGGKELDSGQELLSVFPMVSLADVSQRLAGKRIFIVDKSDELTAMMAEASIDATHVADPLELQSAQADVVVVAADEFGDLLLSQSPLMSLVQAGAQAIVFMQHRPRTLAGYALSRRAVPDNFRWRNQHPLFTGFDEADLKSWFPNEPGEGWAIRLPADEPALEVAYWPPDVAGKSPPPIDALLVVKAVGKGRLVLCQIPLGGWRDDPRSQLLLQNALDYLLTRPEPTPRPSDRLAIIPASAPSIPTIKIPAGDQP